MRQPKVDPMPAISVLGTSFEVVSGPQDAFWARVNLGDWELSTFQALADHVTPETTVFDFGGWIAPISLFAAARVKRVVAFEPDPVAAAEFKANCALNPALAAKITLIEKAVWTNAGTVRMGAKTAQGDSMSSVHHTRSGTLWDAPTVTPDEIAAMLPADGPVFVKIDVEGAEYDIVPALAPILQRDGVVTLVSFHPRFAAGWHPRWHKTLAMTKRVFDVFPGASILRVYKRHVRPAPLVEWLAKLPFPTFEARRSYLFFRRPG